MGASITPDGKVWVRSGALIDPLNIDFAKFTLEDLAFALGHIYRFGGHADPAVTVAQHTLACARLAMKTSPLLGLLALHHDDGEALFGDMLRPIKLRPEMAWYRRAEKRATIACIVHFAPQCADLLPSAVSEIDTRSLLVEARDRFPATKEPANLPDLAPMPASHYYPSDTWLTWIKLHHRLADKADRWLAAEAEERAAEGAG